MSNAFLKTVQQPRGSQAVPVELWLKKDLAEALGRLSASARSWVSVNGWAAGSGEVCLVPSRDGKLAKVLVGMTRLADPFQYARLPQKLPPGKYRIATALDAPKADAAALGWLLGNYAFTRYKRSVPSPKTVLLWPEQADVAAVTALARGVGFGRDLINVPAEDLGPAELAQAARELAETHQATFREVVGDELLKQNYPLIHAVGRASSRAPRLLDLVWGKSQHPKVTLVGKGVCFDSGGLDLKPADNMKLMKKDMGGAATVLALASIVMELALPVRLRVLVPAVENSVSGNAFRPLDVLRSRKGLTIEVGNTDAEGRLVLADALTEADAERPELLIDVATLTGAARVALGTTLPALFSSSDADARALLDAGRRTDDPLWRLPLHRPYRKQLDSRVADLGNVSSSPYGGAITAALFLQEFVSEKTPWLHIDTMAWNLESRPGRPAGGEVFAVRALAELLRRRYARAV